VALKAYKHLTDGEVKLVEGGSAEETALLADTVTGGSYLQMTSAGHAQEIAAAQGTALWVDVTSELGAGGGSSFTHVTEDPDDNFVGVDVTMIGADDPAVFYNENTGAAWQLDPGQLHLQSGAAQTSLSIASLVIGNGAVTLSGDILEMHGNPAVLRLSSSNGTQYDLTVSDAGALVITPT
jgi:hypothetical protein